MSYESDCDDYAIHGNPERDHWEYEENSRYDYYDGHDGCGEQADFAACEDCLDENMCSDCADALACAEAEERADYEENADCCDDPNSPYYVPF